jgi:alkylation response protein AidB-like acyl-CoA dehydrogenase
MDLRYSAEDLAFREATRRWLEANVPGEEPATLEARRAWHRRLYDAGYVGMGWPVAYGGRGATPLQQAVVADEMARAGAPGPINALGIRIVGPTIIVRHRGPNAATPEDPGRRGPGALPEPNAGSDRQPPDAP